jgi:hypothetical protein
VIVFATPAVVAAGAVGLRRSARRARVVTDRRRTIVALQVLCSVAEAGGAVPYAADGLAEVLHLRACHYEDAPPGAGGVPVLGPDGSLSGRIHRRDRFGLLIPDQAHLGAASGGRFALVGHPERSTSLEERLVAAAIAELTRPSPRRSTAGDVDHVRDGVREAGEHQDHEQHPAAKDEPR